jgi:hypothetical protein
MNRKGAFALVALVVACIGLFVVPAMARAAAPEVSLQQAAGQSDPTNDPSIAFSLTSNESLVAGSVTASDFEVTNGTLDGIVVVGPAEYDVVVTADSDGAVAIAPSETFEVTDLDEAETQSTVAGEDRSVTYDGTGPEVVLEQAAGQLDPDYDNLVDFSITANESLDTDSVGPSDFDVTNGIVNTVQGAATSFTVEVIADGDGEVTIAPSGTFEVTDQLGNATTTAAGADRSVTVDTTPAEFTLAAASGQEDPTEDAEIAFSLTSNEPVASHWLDSDEFDVTNGTITSITNDEEHPFSSSFTIYVTATGQGPVSIAPNSNFAVVDVAGNPANPTHVTGTPSVLYDTAPVITVNQAAGQADPTNAATIDFTLSANEALDGASIEASDFGVTNGTFDGVAADGDDFTITVTADGDGDVSIAPSETFSVSDTNGNFPATTFTSNDVTVFYDGTAPATTIEGNPSDPSFDPTPEFDFASDEEGTTFECRLWESNESQPAFEPCLNPYNPAFLPEGNYNFEVRAIDQAGNVGDAAGYVWARQQSALAAGPEEAVYFTRGDTPVEIRVLTEDDQAGEFSYELVDSLGGGTVDGWEVDDDLNTGTATYTPGNGFAGEDILEVRVTNEATGGETLAQVHVLVRPVSKLNSGPGVDAPQLTNDSTPTFTYSAVAGPEEGVVPDATFACRIDGAPMSVSACNTGSITTAELSEGEHTFTVRASKPSINPDTTVASVTFTVDTIAPESPTSLEGPQGLIANSNPSWSFEIPEGSAECRLFVQGDPAPDYEDCDSPAAYEEVADGSYEFQVRTVDDAGNVSAPVSRVIEIDTNVDVTIDSAPADGSTDALPAIEFSSTEDPDVTYECRIYAADTPAEEVPGFTGCDSPRQLPFLDRNTEYVFDVRVTDEAGNTASASATWLQANTAPALSEPTVTLEAGTTAPVDLGGTDADSDVITYEITGEVTGGSLGEIDQDTGLVDFTANEAATGEHTIAYSVTDDREGGTTTGTITILIQPNTEITNDPAAETNDTTPTFEFDSPAEGVETFECNLDDTGWEACDSGSYTPAAELAEGAHTFAVRAVDGALADPTPATFDFTVDLTAPDVAITDNPAELSNVAAPQFSFESTDETATFECQVDDGEFAACESGDAIAELTDGDHTFTVRSVDPGGNVSDPVATYAWEVDLTNPEINLTSGPLTDDWTNARRPFWEFDESDLNLVPESTRCRVDAQSWVDDCLSPWQPAANLNDGMHTVTFEATDAAGNTETVEHTFRVTTITPTVVIDEGPASPSGPSVSFSFSSTTDLGENGKFQCRINTNGGGYSAWEDCDEELTLEELSSGSRTLQVRAVDSAGNHSTGAAIGSWTWNTVGGSPDTVITGQTLNRGNAAFGFNSPGNPLATFECQIDNGAWSACSSPKTYSGLGAGSHTFSVRSTNQVGTTDQSPATHTWDVAAAADPDTSITRKPAASSTLTSATFEFSSSEAVATFECRIDGGAWEACESPKSYTGLAVADHTFEVRSTSDGRTDASPASAAWKVVEPAVDPTDPPVCNPVAPAASKSKVLRVGKKLRVVVRLSHRKAIADQKVTAKLLVNGKTPKGKLRKRAAKALKGVDITGSSGIVASLKPRKATATFEAGADTRSNLRVLAKRKKGKALRTSVAFTLQSCDQ